MTKIKVILIGVAIAIAYVCGYSNANTKAELEMTRYKLDLAESMKSALLKEKEKYDLKEQTLIDSFNRDRDQYDGRVRQLESKLRAKSSCEKVTGERDRALKLAVEGEKLLKDARRYIEALK